MMSSILIRRGLLIPATTIFVCASLVSDASAGKAALDDPTADWSKGPVKYVLTSDEEKSYSSLGSKEARRKAIEEFWARRDPTPGTPENEYREHFLKRVESVNALFGAEGKEGWTTDAGRIVLIAGYPEDRGLQKGGKELWLYKRFYPVPGRSPEAAARTHVTMRVVFDKVTSGKHALTYDGNLVHNLQVIGPLEAAKFSMKTSEMPALKPEGELSPLGLNLDP
jgi:GWxTD domain-containing protein